LNYAGSTCPVIRNSLSFDLSRKSYQVPSLSQLITPEREELFWIHVVRVAAAFGVVVVHVAADVITQWGDIPRDWWWAANVYDSLARGCVPVFIMVSGALLLPVQESYRDFFRKRFNRIFFPFLVWTIFYLIWKKVLFLPDMGAGDAWVKVLAGSVCFHLWFFYILAGMYLVTPVFRILALHATRRDLAYFLGLWFVVASCIPFLEKVWRFTGHAGVHVNLPLEPVQGFIGYFVMGHFIRRYVSERWVLQAWGVWLGCFLVCLVGTWALTSWQGDFNSLLYDNLAPNIVLFCASFFILARALAPVIEARWRPQFRSALIDLSKAGFGIYLIHPMVLDVIERGRFGVSLSPLDLHPAMAIAVIAVAGYLVSFVIVWLIQQVPGLKRIV
jgi:surface polysaccharide O-acyltransferase-like enzyme